MQLSKTAYYGDFAAYAIILAALIADIAMRADWAARARWAVALLIGAALWTLLEYILHRFVLHRVSIFASMHEVHHASPRAYVGTPTWASLAVLWLVFFLPAWLIVSFIVASGLITGVMLGFFWYGVLHHAIHFRRPRLLASRLPGLSYHHLRHHAPGNDGNFGVTTPLWDYLFGTVIQR
jgi:sterol desaturase/sphingolipid hydroxylase (fatty acid hydroxylase superfamily)